MTTPNNQLMQLFTMAVAMEGAVKTIKMLMQNKSSAVSDIARPNDQGNIIDMVSEHLYIHLQQSAFGQINLNK